MVMKHRFGKYGDVDPRTLPGAIVDEHLVGRVRARATGADIHTVEGLVGTYRRYCEESQHHRKAGEIAEAEEAEIHATLVGNVLRGVAAGAFSVSDAFVQVVELVTALASRRD